MFGVVCTTELEDCSALATQTNAASSRLFKSYLRLPEWTLRPSTLLASVHLPFFGNIQTPFDVIESFQWTRYCSSIVKGRSSSLLRFLTKGIGWALWEQGFYEQQSFAVSPSRSYKGPSLTGHLDRSCKPTAVVVKQHCIPSHLPLAQTCQLNSEVYELWQRYCIELQTILLASVVTTRNTEGLKLRLENINLLPTTQIWIHLEFPWFF